MTAYSAPTYIVVRPNLRQQAEDAAIAADPEGVGTFIPGVPLREAGDVTNVIVAYWCRWNMKPTQRTAFASSMPGPSPIIRVGGNVDRTRDRWMLDASEGQWTPDAVLAALGMDTLVYEGGP